MNCFCCDPEYFEITDKNTLKHHYIIHTLEEGTRQFCLLCNQSLTYKLVYCKNCQYTIGHIDCVEKWLKNEDHPRCPKCKK